MATRGLFIGINDYPGTQLDLAGCVNDAVDWRDAIGPYSETTKLLLDKDATREAILEETRALLSGLRAGDWGVLTFSGHGSWLPDTDGDEQDGRDECLIPHDYQNPILDDEIHHLLQDRPAGSLVFLVSDACNSGTVYRMFRDNDEPTRLRFMDPARVMSKLGTDARTQAEVLARRVRLPKVRVSPGIVHFAGCRDNEYCYDAVFDGRPNGSFSYTALKALQKMRSNSSFNSWHQYIRRYLPSYGFPQTPQCNARKEAARWRLPWV